MMRQAYSRSGLAVVALYGVLSAVSGIAVTAVLFGSVFTDMTGILLGGGELSDAFALMNSAKYRDMVLLGSTVGSLAGVGIGVLIMRLILKKRTVPIERRDLSVKEILTVILVTYGLWGVGTLLGNLPEFFGVLSLDLTSSDPVITLCFCIHAVFFAPVLEELAFRKLLIDRIHPYGTWIAAATSALLFALFHGNAAQFPLAFGVGLVSATVYLKTGRIAYSILLHVMINLTGTLPELFGLLHVDVRPGWSIAVLVLTLTGDVTIFLNRKQELFHLTRSPEPDANRQAFKNPGMLFALIGGLAVLGITELFLLYGALQPDENGRTSALALIRLVPVAVTVTAVIWTLTRPYAASTPEADRPESQSRISQTH